MVRTIFCPHCFTINVKEKNPYLQLFVNLKKQTKVYVPARYHLQRSSHLFSVHFSKLSSLRHSHVLFSVSRESGVHKLHQLLDACTNLNSPYCLETPAL